MVIINRSLKDERSIKKDIYKKWWKDIEFNME